MTAKPRPRLWTIAVAIGSLFILTGVAGRAETAAPRLTPIAGGDALAAAPAAIQVEKDSSVLLRKTSQLGKIAAADHTCVVGTTFCNSTVTSTLTDHDCDLEDGTFADFWEFEGNSGDTVTIDLSSNDFDTFLFLLDPTPAVVASDDDSGPGLNSRLVHTLDSSGTWSIGANNFAPGPLGTYTLSLECQTSGTGTPAAPSNLTATALSSSEIELLWADNSNDEDEFRVEMRTTLGAFQDIGSVPADSIGAEVGGLLSSTTYTFRVRARNQAGDSPYSNQASATTFSTGVGCQPNATTLCLNNNRFSVQVEWRDFEDNTGPGQVVPFGTDDSGLFFFFNSDNWEMLAKVLRGCPINDHYWVFFAATTDVEFTLTVVDTQAGTTNTYTNPLGHPADAITDTAAFATCP